MVNLTRLGRFLFVAGIIGFGLMHCFYAITTKAPVPGPPWIPGIRVWTGVMGVFLVASGAAMMTKARARVAAGLFAAVVLLLVLIHYVSLLIANVRNPGPWTSAFELLAMCGAVLILAVVLPVEDADYPPSSSAANIGIWTGRLFFAALLLVVGIQHIMYGNFVATLVPGWIPVRLFWAYFVGVAFLAATLAIVTGVKQRLASILLGAMFFSWVLIVHLPRIAGAIHNGNEWTSGLVALAMSGGALIVGSGNSEAATRGSSL
jgi:uncharacterized membrane protein YphA (DoxX/SURF4 family)